MKPDDDGTTPPVKLPNEHGLSHEPAKRNPLCDANGLFKELMEIPNFQKALQACPTCKKREWRTDGLAGNTLRVKCRGNDGSKKCGKSASAIQIVDTMTLTNMREEMEGDKTLPEGWIEEIARAQKRLGRPNGNKCVWSGQGEKRTRIMARKNEDLEEETGETSKSEEEEMQWEAEVEEGEDGSECGDETKTSGKNEEHEKTREENRRLQEENRKLREENQTLKEEITSLKANMEKRFEKIEKSIEAMHEGKQQTKEEKGQSYKTVLVEHNKEEKKQKIWTTAIETKRQDPDPTGEGNDTTLTREYGRMNNKRRELSEDEIERLLDGKKHRPNALQTIYVTGFVQRERYSIMRSFFDKLGIQSRWITTMNWLRDTTLQMVVFEEKTQEIQTILRERSKKIRVDDKYDMSAEIKTIEDLKRAIKRTGEQIERLPVNMWKTREHLGGIKQTLESRMTESGQAQRENEQARGESEQVQRPC